MSADLPAERPDLKTDHETPEGARDSSSRYVQLSARMLHDIRNQIGGLKLYASWLRRHPALSASDTPVPDQNNRQEAGEIIDKLLGALDTLGRQTQLFSRLIVPLTLKPAPAALGSLLTQLPEESAVVLRQRQLQTQIRLHSESAEISCDPLLTPIALRGLFVRLATFCQPGETIHISSPQETILDFTGAGSQPLTGQQCMSFFELDTDQRASPEALELALAGKVFAAHGWQTEIIQLPPATLTIRIHVIV